MASNLTASLKTMDNLNCKVIFVFPGQGSQYVGMGSDIHAEFAEARAVYDQASETLGFDMAELSFRDPEDKLNRTQFTQLALLTHSVACLRVYQQLTQNNVEPFACAGHSLGEYSSLVAAGALEFEDALKLVERRGQLMSEHGRGKMMAFPLDLETVRSFVSSHYCGIGGCNLPEQTVVGGDEKDLVEAGAYVKEKFRKRGTLLNTEGAFHTYLMTKAAEEFRPFLASTPMKSPAVKVISNYSGSYHSDNPDEIKALLFFQLFNPVKWIWGMQHALRDGVHTVVEFGGGIGKGETPAEKRPNLAGITSKAIKSVNQYGRYLPAINCETLRQSARMASGVDGKQYYLFVPTVDDEIAADYTPVLNSLDQLGVAPIIHVICEPEPQNLQRLQTIDSGVASPQPCLVGLDENNNPISGPCYGEQIEQQLTELGQLLQGTD
jgi:malonyl CoA-acyl carrier protein transacylase